MEFISHNTSETRQIAEDFIKNALNDKSNKSFDNMATVVGLYGELGSGKTTFMKYVASFLGVENTIQSPTFVIMKKYEIENLESGIQNLAQTKIQDPKLSNFPTFYFQTLIHIDAYRIEKNEEMLNLGWESMVGESTNLIFIEWPEKIIDIMPPHIKVCFEHISENERKITITK